MSSLNKSSFLKIFLSYLPIIMLFYSVFNEFDFNYLKLDYFSFNFPFILIFFFTLKDFKNFDYFFVWLITIIFSSENKEIFLISSNIILLFLFMSSW